MSNSNNHNHSNTDNEFFHHQERTNGTRDLFYGQYGQKDKKGKNEHNHAVIDPNGNVKFIRENSHIKTDQINQTDQTDD